MRLAYFSARFPLLSETFILNEMKVLEELGCKVTMFAIHEEREKQHHPDAYKFMEAAVYGDKPIKLAISQLSFLWNKPKTLFKLWLTLIRNFGRRPDLLWRNGISLLAGVHFAHYIAGQQFDHLHAHWANHTTFAAYCTAQLTGLKYSYTAHANDIFFDQTMLAEKTEVATNLITISEFNQSWLKQFILAKDHHKIKVVRCGIDIAQFNAPSKPHQFNDKPIFVCLARLNEKKGHHYLIEACAELKRANHAFECWLIGGGDLATTIQAQVRALGLEDHVKLLGALTQPRVVERLSQAHYMVLPSITTAVGYREGIPVSLMEGMAVGLPVVATEISGIPELVQHNLTGILVPEKNSKALASAMIELSTDSQLALRLANAGQQLVRDKYDLHKNCKELLSLFQSTRSQIGPLLQSFDIAKRGNLDVH